MNMKCYKQNLILFYLSNYGKNEKIISLCKDVYEYTFKSEITDKKSINFSEFNPFFYWFIRNIIIFLQTIHL